MSRRHRFNPVASGTGISGERASLGDNHVQTAINTLTQWSRASVAMMAPFEHSREAVFPMIFADDVRQKALAAKNYIIPSGTYANYNMGERVTLGINFDGALLPTLSKAAFKPDPDRATALLEWINQVLVINDKFEVAKHVIRWLNRNATPGAIRYYFPSAMKLCPSSPALLELQDTPVRFTTPIGINEQLPLIREAANTVATAALMDQDAKPNGVSNLWVICQQVKIKHPEANVAINTDQMTYYI